MFLNTIAETGRIHVPHPEQDPPDLSAYLEDDVVAREAVHRLDLMQPVPNFHRGAASWAAQMLYRCCQFLIYRDVDKDAVKHVLGTECPVPADAGVCYSVDVALCYLPDVFALAGGVSPEDALVEAIKALGRAWPLSSVGIPELGALDIAAFIGDPCLCDLYVQRLVKRNQRDRIDYPAVRAALKRAVGDYHDLAPGLMSALTQEVSH